MKKKSFPEYKIMPNTTAAPDIRLQDQGSTPLQVSGAY